MSDLAAAVRPRLSMVTWGEAATTSLLVAIGSGIVLAIPYDPSAPLASVATMLLANPAAAYFRNVHYWSAQAFLMLSVVHIWDHIRRRDARAIRLGVWTRLCLGVPAIGLLAWSGFVLKGDVEAWQAWRVVSTTIHDLPFIGAIAAKALFGRDEQLFLVYVHHMATFTLFVWVVAVEHGRVLWPRAAAVVLVAAPIAALALIVAPQLHDGLSAVVRGPWYFMGLQEAFHWSPWPRVVVAVATLPVLALFAMRWMGPAARSLTSHALLAVAIVYLGFTGVAWAFRGPNWSWTDAWRSAPPSVVLASIFATPDPAGEPLRGRPVPMVMARPEGCLVCHERVTGLSDSHDPGKIGCASCHLGNVFSLDAATAHRGMRLVPGNLDDADRTCGGECHPAVVTRVTRSLMASNAGIVFVNRHAFGESSARPPHVTGLDQTPADSHLRQLCATCHLGAPKTEPWPITEESRGGGCTACHLTYRPESLEDLVRYRAAPAGRRQPPRSHPDVALPSDNMPCFGCHSRSGRISLAYEGWHEASPVPSRASGTVVRRLDDGRDVVPVTPDAHASKGMLCVDCHTAREVMGDGHHYLRQLDQPHVRCEDCHAPDGLRSVPAGRADEESRRLIALRKLPSGKRQIIATRSADVLINGLVDEHGGGTLVTKSDGRQLVLNGSRPECTAPAHARVSCIGCHTAWAPRCPSCHTSFDPGHEGFDNLADATVHGEWLESGSGFVAAPPTLAMRRVSAGGEVRETFEPVVPGMIATLDTSQAPGGRPSVFRRWYARTFSHTVTRAGRTCVSCHNDPVALGYGEGQLDFVAAGPGRGRWQFARRHPPGPDGLPSDAWIGFLQTRMQDVSSRADVRPLSVAEQQKVLTAGACLTCHREDSAVMRAALIDFAGVQRRLTARCRAPLW